MFNHEETIWMAGFFDGEGSITVTNKLGIKISIVNTNANSVRLFQRTFGGKVRILKRSGRKDINRWQCPYTKHLDFLETLISYSRVKKEHFTLAYRVVINRQKLGKKRSLRYLQLALHFRERLKDLNERIGKHGTTGGSVRSRGEDIRSSQKESELL